MTKKLLRILQRFIIGFFIVTISWVLIYRFIPIVYTPLMGIRAIEQYFNPEKEYHFRKKWVSIDKISHHLIDAVIAAEDQKFRQHHGFDLDAIKKSMAHNSKKNQKRIKGASTISQQTAKNAFLWPQRNWVRKGLEAYFTVLIELFWNKERILEVYLNIIEMGDGIYGAEAAAKHYFGKHASQLNRYEAASIAAILPSPLRRSAIKPGSRTQQHIYWIEQQMQKPAEAPQEK